MQDRDSERTTLPDAAVKRVRWLVDPDRGLILPISGIWILALDWILFSSNLLSAGLATPIVMVLGFLLGGGGVLVLQKWLARDGLLKAVAKGGAAGVAVGVPWPLAGTLFGGWILLASGMKRRSPKSSHNSNEQ